VSHIFFFRLVFFGGEVEGLKIFKCFYKPILVVQRGFIEIFP
jgi:hypothetical protein